jgi:hypothetical protein
MSVWARYPWRKLVAKRRGRLAVEALEDRTLPSVAIGVDASANRHAIDPNVYGTAFASTAQLADLNVPLNRDGGNASDTYSFQQDATNHGSDWFFESILSGPGNGLSYGWNSDNSVNARDRDSSRSPDELHDGFIHMQKPSDPNASWKIAVPNGTYTVHLVAGDPDNFDSVFKINVNGTLAVNGTPTSANRWLQGTVTVTVTNGVLVVSNATGSVNNKIDYIDITPVTAAAPKAAALTAAPAGGPLPAPQAVSVGKFDAGFGFQMNGLQASLALSFQGDSGKAALTFDAAANAVILSAGGAAPVRLKAGGLDLGSGHTFAVSLHYDGVTLAVRLTDTTAGATFGHAFRVNLPRLVGTSALAVFSGAADVLNWWTRAL